MRKGVAAVSPSTAPVLSADEIPSSFRTFAVPQDLALPAYGIFNSI